MHCPSICTPIFSFDYLVLQGSVVVVAVAVARGVFGQQFDPLVFEKL